MNRNAKVGMISFAALGMLTAGAMVVDAANPPSLQTQAKRKEPKKNAENANDKKMPALAFKMKDIDDKMQDLRQYQGNVVLMVNVASKCGLTPQYEQLQAAYKKYQDKGFVVLGFPANNFMKQEPGSNEEIKQFCTSRFEVTFPMFAKVSVKGDDICPLYKYLTDEKADHKKGGEIKWNFDKYLVDRSGKVVERFDPRMKPDDEKIIASLEKYLAEAIPEDSALAKKRKAEKEKDEKEAGKPMKP